jgi:DNA-binding transcriptional ArsR family regulator
MPRLDTAYVAGLFADRSRVAMFDVLMDSREHALGALARAAGIAASTATEHLSRPEDVAAASAIRDSGDFSQIGSKPSLDDWFAPGA